MREDRSLGRAMTMTVRLSGPIRRDKARSEQEAFDHLKAELERAFGTRRHLPCPDRRGRDCTQRGAVRRMTPVPTGTGPPVSACFPV